MKLPTAEGVRDAEALIRPLVPETPLVRSELLSRALHAEVWLKLEGASPIASFKLRGALAAIERARAIRSIPSVCTSSTGNHGQGVAYAARLLGLAADIFLPTNPNPVKRKMIEAFGARIVDGGTDIDEAKDAAKAFASRAGALFVDDGESLDMMEGAGTVGLEIARRLEDLDMALFPMGSGTLAAGSAVSVKERHGRARAIAVQAKGSPSMVESFRAGRPISLPVRTIADGLVTRVPAERALASLLAHVDDAVTVSEEALLPSVRTLVEMAHVLAEPSGAATLAAAWDRRGELAGLTVALVVSGANIATETLAAALAGPPLISGR
jgi:threonine dehydratase